MAHGNLKLLGTCGVVLLLQTLTTKGAILDSARNCPSAEELKPCVCTDLGIDCSDVTGGCEIWESLQFIFQSAQFNNFWLENNPDFTEFPGEALHEVKFTSIFLRNNSIKTIDPKSFVNTRETLTQLSLANNKLEAVPCDALVVLNKLQVLDLSHNSLVEVGEHCLNNVSSLQKIHLSNNKINRIGGRSLHRLIELQLLDLSRNNIYVLGANSLELGSLSRPRIYLDDNRINNVHESTFVGPPPNSVSIKNNLLRAIKERAFVNVVKYCKLDVTGNNFTCHGCEFKWLIQMRNEINIDGFRCSNGMTLAELNPENIGCR